MKKKIFLIILCALILSFILFRAILLIAYVDGESMNPYLNDKDIVIGTRNTNGIENGDIIIFKKDEIKNIKLIKRVIAKGGQRVKGENGFLFIDGQKTDIPSPSFEEITIYDDCFFVCGDNYQESNDSRVWADDKNISSPLIKKEDIIGIINYRIFPKIKKIRS